MINKTEKLPEAFINSIRIKREEIMYDMDKIRDRVGYIIKKVGEIYGHKIDYWHYDTDITRICEELDQEVTGDVFDLDNEVDIEIKCYVLGKNACSVCIGMGVDGSHLGFMSVKLKDGKYASLASRIPYRFLFEDFEEEVKNGKAAYEEECKDSIEKHKTQEIERFKKNMLEKKQDYTIEEWNKIIEDIK